MRMRVRESECPVNVRSQSGQPCALCRTGDFSVLATARHTRVCLRVAVLHKSPRPASVCSAAAPIVTAFVTLVEFGAVARDTGEPGLPCRRCRLSASCSRRYRSPSASRCFVGGIPPSRLACVCRRYPRTAVRRLAPLRLVIPPAPHFVGGAFLSFFLRRRFPRRLGRPPTLP